MKTMTLALLALAMLLFGCTGEETPAGEMPEGELEGTGEPEEPQKEIAVLETSHGVIEIELYRESAPITVENFVGYVNSGFYEGTIFHRIIPGFMVQGGGFTEDGTEKETNPPIVLESDNGLSNERGTVAMARTMVADSATSQFFINTVDNPALDYGMGTEGYAVFGKVISGMDEAVIAIETTPTTSRAMHDNWPVENIVIQKAYMKN